MDNAAPEDKIPDQLVRYLDGELTGNEKQDMEKKIAMDTALQQELENLQLAREAVRRFGLHRQVGEVRRLMLEEKQALVKKMGQTRRFVRLSLAVAASILVVVLAIAGYNFYSLSASGVFADHYQVYEPGTVRDGGANETAIEKAYREKRYQEVITIVPARPVTANELFLRGIANLETGQPANGIASFQQVLARPEAGAILKEEAEYYLALAYIRDKDYDPALRLLHRIRNNPAHLYHSQVSGRFVRQVRLLKWK
jgi:tetratricopeptide (TPR) repeat protein